MANSKSSPKKVLFCLALLFALPPVMGWLMFLNPDWLPDPVAGGAELVQPPRLIYDLPMTSASGERFDWPALTENWMLVAIGFDACVGPCLDVLTRIGQYQAALGGERHRINKVVLIQQTSDEPVEIPNQGADYVGINDPRQSKVLEELFNLRREEAANSLYVVDPKGYVMLRHDIKAMPYRSFIKTLEKLVTISSNW